MSFFTIKMANYHFFKISLTQHFGTPGRIRLKLDNFEHSDGHFTRRKFQTNSTLGSCKIMG